MSIITADNMPSEINMCKGLNWSFKRLLLGPCGDNADGGNDDNDGG